MHLIPLFQTITICLIFILFEAMIATRQGRDWFEDLNQQGKSVSVDTWYWIGGLFYLVCGVIAYRLFTIVDKRQFLLSFSLLFGIMLTNTLMVAFLFKVRSMTLAWVSNFLFCLLTGILFFRFLDYDLVSAILLFAYLGWSIYNVYYFNTLRKIHSNSKSKVRRIQN